MKSAAQDTCKNVHAHSSSSRFYTCPARCCCPPPQQLATRIRTGVGVEGVSRTGQEQSVAKTVGKQGPIIQVGERAYTNKRYVQESASRLRVSCRCAVVRRPDRTRGDRVSSMWSGWRGHHFSSRPLHRAVGTGQEESVATAVGEQRGT